MAGGENSFCSLKLAPSAVISASFHNTRKYIYTLLGEKLLAVWSLLLISNQKEVRNEGKVGRRINKRLEIQMNILFVMYTQSCLQFQNNGGILPTKHKKYCF